MEELVKEIIAAGGSALLIPAVLFVLVLYVIRGLSGLHGRRSQNRKEFLDLWDSTRSQDDLWLEVVVRHLFGSYLPARVIRLALAQPDKAQSLLDLAELWPLFRFDPASQTVSWLHKRHDTLKRLKAGRTMLLGGRFRLRSYRCTVHLLSPSSTDRPASQAGCTASVRWSSVPLLSSF